MPKCKKVATSPSSRAEIDNRESRSRGYAAGYDGLPINSGDGSKAWNEGWHAAVDATGGKRDSGLLFS